MTLQSAAILGSEMRIMESRQSGRSYRITIALPLGYAADPGEAWPFNDMPATWPVVYVLDGNWYFGMVTDTIRPMSWCGRTTDAIVVGIGYPDDGAPTDAFRTSFTRRNADLTPVRDEAEEKLMEERHHRSTPTGDAAGFLRFLQDELIPMIEAEYRADPSRRILLGHSYGGLFALNAMLEAPALFQTLIMGSPTLEYGNECSFAQEEAYAAAHSQLPARVFLFVGELEDGADDPTLNNTNRLAATLQARNYADFALTKQIFPDQGHCEVAAPGFQAGLKFALAK